MLDTYWTPLLGGMVTTVNRG